MIKFINSNNYTVIEYSNLDKPYSPLYFEIIPNINSDFDVPASGVTSFSATATSALNRLVAVSGNTQALHLFGEDSNNIIKRLQNGRLKLVGLLK